MRSGTEKAAAVVGIAVVAAALWGAGYWQGGRSARTLTDGSTAKTTQNEEKTPVLTVARDLSIAENDAIPGLDGRCEARLETSARGRRLLPLRRAKRRGRRNGGDAVGLQRAAFYR